MTTKNLCLQVSLHEMGYLKQNLCFRERKNALNLNDVSKCQPNCQPNVAAVPFLGSCYIKDNWGML